MSIIQWAIPYLIAAPMGLFALGTWFYRSSTPRKLRAWNQEDEQAAENVKNSEKPGQNLFSDSVETSTRKRI